MKDKLVCFRKGGSLCFWFFFFMMVVSWDFITSSAAIPMLIVDHVMWPLAFLWSAWEGTTSVIAGWRDAKKDVKDSSLKCLIKESAFRTTSIAEHMLFVKWKQDKIIWKENMKWILPVPELSTSSLPDIDAMEKQHSRSVWFLVLLSPFKWLYFLLFVCCFILSLCKWATSFSLLIFWMKW